MLGRICLSVAAVRGRVIRLFTLLLALVASPALARGGAAQPRTAPELSDLALFVLAAAAVWLTRRALRRRHARKD